MIEDQNKAGCKGFHPGKKPGGWKLIRLIYIVLGLLCVGLGILGMLLPVLPTTPFLLLAAFFFARSSDMFYKWLLQNKVFGNYLRNYLEKRGIPLRVKIFSLCLLWLTIGYAVFYIVSAIWVQVFLLIIASAVTFHILTIKTLGKGQKE
jgi:uncharacterized protein